MTRIKINKIIIKHEQIQKSFDVTVEKELDYVYLIQRHSMRIRLDPTNYRKITGTKIVNYFMKNIDKTS